MTSVTWLQFWRWLLAVCMMDPGGTRLTSLRRSLIGCALVVAAGATAYFVVVEQQRVHFEKVIQFKYRVKALTQILDDYATSHGGQYPDRLNVLAQQDADQAFAHFHVPDGSRDLTKWLLIQPAASREEALRLARAIPPSTILYCPIRRGEKVDAYYVLGKDELNQLLATDSNPLVVSSPGAR
jgi:hypothetical protein